MVSTAYYGSDFVVVKCQVQDHLQAFRQEVCGDLFTRPLHIDGWVFRIQNWFK